jgi:serine/threonine protein kinase/tetratricopeptide (TPR) repeat protein
MSSCDFSDFSVDASGLQRLSGEQRDRLTAILDRYLCALEGGAPPDRDELLQAHPDLAEPLAAYLSSLDQLHDAAAGFGHPAALAGPQPEPAAGGDEKRLGDFRILREVGRGGMGVVYEAYQISLGRRVALKVLPFAAVLDSKQVARFKNEAQAAAQLHHPNIVSVYAVGVERGVHYYAMQFIDGQPLDVALAELRRAAGIDTDLPADDAADGEPVGSVPTGRLPQATRSSLLTAHSHNRSDYFGTVIRLGIQAAEALHAAHEYGIVHRDIKPSNLILDGEGNLWVTDFGLARCQADSSLTRTGDVVGTARYMSPEQASGQTALVDSRTDVYSLGTTLYELLVLQAAFPGDDGPALLRQIDQQDPRPLRQLEPRIPADLETVVLKAMAKRREERYLTAQDFADDLRRVLEGRPTIARPPTLPERVGKWARRHRRIVVAGAAVGLCAMLGMAASTLLIAREKTRAEHNFQLAERRFHEAREAVDRFGAQLAERLADVPGTDQVRSELLGETLRYYRNFVDQAQGDPALRADLATTYSKIGTLIGEIGSTQEALDAQRSALALWEQLAAENPDHEDYRRRLALCRNNLALALRSAGRTEDARRAYQEAIGLQRQLATGQEAESLSGLALAHANLGLLESEIGELDKAEQSFHEAIRLQEQLLTASPNDPERLRNLAGSLNNLSVLYLGDQPGRAEVLYQKALPYQIQAAKARPRELKYQRDVALTYNNLGMVQSRTKQLPQAAASYGKAIEILRALVRAAPSQNSYRRDLAVSHNNLGMLETRLGRPADAERSFREALELEESLVVQNPHDVDLHSSLGGIYNNLAMVLEELQRPADAAESCRKAIEHQKLAFTAAPNVSRYRVFLSKHYYNYGRILLACGRAEDAARAALARRELWPRDAGRLVAVAEELALASKSLSADHVTGLSGQRCAEYAVETLQRAVAAGWKPPADFDRNASFAVLKDYPGFAGLVKQ